MEHKILRFGRIWLVSLTFASLSPISSLFRKGKGRISCFHGTVLIYPFTPTGDFQGWLLAKEALEVQLHCCFSVKMHHKVSTQMASHLLDL